MLLVIFFHAGQVNFGWIGVPVFYVLSGHLITRILVERRDGSRAQRGLDFFRNRALRLAPLYLSGCVALSVLAIVGRGPRQLRGDLPFLWTWTYDFRSLFPGYVDNSLYDHTWSLGVEVQLYILWALMGLLLNRQWLTRVLIALVLLGPLLRVVLWIVLAKDGFSYAGRITATYMLPTTYIDAFAIGGCTALPEVRAMLGAPWRWLVGAATVFALGAGLGIASSLRHHGGMPNTLGYPIGMAAHVGWVWSYSVVALLAGSIVLVVLDGGRLRAWLSVRPLVWLGVVSYGVYLIHRPVLWLVVHYVVRNAGPFSARAVASTVLAVAVTACLACLSYRFVERPFMVRKRNSLLGRRVAASVATVPNVAPEHAALATDGA